MASVEAAEKESAAMLLSELREHLNLARDFLNLIGEALVCTGMRPLYQCSQSYKVSSLLMVRLANDLRCMALLAERGYPLQTLTICSSIYEVAITIARAGEDDVLAQQWLDYDKPDASFLHLKQTTEEVFKKRGIPDPVKQAEADYRAYGQFCMAKHANPLLQKSHGMIEQGRNLSLQNGPDTSDFAIRNLWFAMDYATRYVYIALVHFTDTHVPTQDKMRIANRANELGAGHEQLRQLARKRWGTEDPFQGKWKKW